MSLKNFLWLYYQVWSYLIDLNPNKSISLANLSIYYTQENIKSAYNSSKVKVSAPTWNDEFHLPDASHSISDIQDYF